MLYKNAYLYTAERRFLHGGFRVEGGRFAAVFGMDGMDENSAGGNAIGRDKAMGRSEDCAPEPSEDLGGAYVIPGLVDIHTHGCDGADFSDGDLSGLRRMGAWYARHGVTSFAPASMTLPIHALEAAFQTAVDYRDAGRDSCSKQGSALSDCTGPEGCARLAGNCTGPEGRARLAGNCTGPEGCARLAGIYMEGPFLSHARRGAQNAAYLRTPDIGAFRALYDGCGGLVRVVCAAPELDGAASFARAAARLCTVSAAHTDAGYDTASAFFDAGASHLTHLFNAMPPLLHRSPGVIGAAAERDGVTAEIICDGLHVHPAAVRAAFRLFPGRLCLISDSLRLAGIGDRMGEGTPDGACTLAGRACTLGGQEIVLRQGRAVLPDGTLAGSVVSLFDALRNTVAFGVPPEEAVAAATILPARVLGRDREIGSIEPGKRADFIVCDGPFCAGQFREGQFREGKFQEMPFRRRRVFLGGQEVPGSGET